MHFVVCGQKSSRFLLTCLVKNNLLFQLVLSKGGCWIFMDEASSYLGNAVVLMYALTPQISDLRTALHCQSQFHFVMTKRKPKILRVKQSCVTIATSNMC